MAYEQNFDDDEQNPAAPTTSGPEGGMTSTSSAPTASSTPSQPSKTGTGSGFTNLMSYVDANAGRSKGMADQVAGGIKSNLAGTQAKADQFKTSASNAIQSGTVKDNGVINKLQTTPQDTVKNSWDLVQQNTAGYKGPNSASEVQGYQDISKGFQDVDKQVNQTKSLEGRTTLAKDTFGKDNQYTAGENRLDGFLLGAGQGAQSLADFQNQYAQSYQPPAPAPQPASPTPAAQPPIQQSPAAAPGRLKAAPVKTTPVKALPSVYSPTATAPTESGNPLKGWEAILAGIENEIGAGKHQSDQIAADTKGKYNEAVLKAEALDQKAKINEGIAAKEAARVEEEKKKRIAAHIDEKKAVGAKSAAARVAANPPAPAQVDPTLARHDFGAVLSPEDRLNVAKEPERHQFGTPPELDETKIKTAMQTGNWEELAKLVNSGR